METDQTIPGQNKHAVTLQEKFGYLYDENGFLKNSETGEGFQFVDQKHYEELGDLVTNYIQEEMKLTYGLQEVWIPKDFEGSAKSNIFISQDWEQNTSKALLLIQGAGAVRPGIWARSVVINESLETGSMLPAIREAQNQGYSLLVFNPNVHRDPETKEPIPLNDTLSAHSNYMWSTFVSKSPAQEIFIIAHSCGGVSTMELMKLHWEDFSQRVKGIAFTDSVHSVDPRFTKEQKDFLMEKSVDWVASKKQRDELVMKKGYNGCVNVSAGHTRHEYTTGYAFPSIFPFFSRLSEGSNPYHNI